MIFGLQRKNSRKFEKLAELSYGIQREFLNLKKHTVKINSFFYSPCVNCRIFE